MPIQCSLPDIVIPDKSLSEVVLERMLGYGDAVAMVDNTLDGKEFTFNEFRDKIRCCAGSLNKQGLKQGDTVGLCAPTCLEFPVAMFGILSCGAKVAPCNPEYTKGEIIQQFKISEPNMVFVNEGNVELMKEVLKELSYVEKLFVIGRSEEFSTLNDMLLPENEKDFPQNVEINPSEDVCMLPHSSGTTGLPKSVMLTHTNLVACSLIGGHATGYTTTDSFYMDRPMFNMGGFGVAIFTLMLGVKLVLDKDSNVEKILAAVEKYKITHLPAVPSLMILLAKTDEYFKYDTSSLKLIPCGGASLSEPIMNALKERYKVKIAPMYGMTECSPISINNDAENFLSSVGSAAPNTIVKVVDLTTGDELGCDQNGEIMAKGPQVMKGYMRNPEATDLTIDKDGWIHTGDIGYYDKNGMLYVIDRLKEVIKYKTHQVPPAELESLILKHPKVADVGVIGIPDDFAGEVPKAYVVRKDETLSKDEIIEFVKNELVEYKHLRGGVDFIEAIPKSAGKIRRRELKKLAGF
uniref:4-coumarate--CoA ligase 1-like n=1 Tax=Styela clava TaxID=7725 RepID=UPI001939D419|nr:4-coumarate--CoA ligase 1-like [Styela clava]XP_039270374.1 4-coumarate--CoA ligase 1-like [Styela clava]XP_039270382.1 4-coumarate--CoA ligase 1-like [Styela clava]